MLTPRQGRHGRRPPSRLFLIALIAAVAGVLSFTIVMRLSQDFGGTHAGTVTGTVGGGAPSSWPAWGFTHTQFSVDADQAPVRSRTDLARQHVVQDTAIMGWGADNPEPAPGQFSFGSLDKRMKAIRATHGTPVITLCCSPDWMKGGAAGQTDWSKLETAPAPQHYDDYARLAAEVARRYPYVKYYVVWNEFKGFFDNARNRWGYENYTAFYNKVYSALKSVNPDLKVGGPYLAMNSNAPSDPDRSAVRGPWGSLDQRVIDAVRYWMKNKKGADFLAVDGWSLPEQRNSPMDEFAALSKFSAVTAWLRGLGSGLPVWWAEWYVEPPGSGWTDEHRGAVQAAAMMEFVRGGASTALYWSPQTSTAGECSGCLWSGKGGGTPTLTMLQNFARWFRPGSKLVGVTSSNPQVRVLATGKQLLAVNTSGDPAAATIDGTKLDLGPYEVRWVSW